MMRAPAFIPDGFEYPQPNIVCGACGGLGYVWAYKTTNSMALEPAEEMVACCTCHGAGVRDLDADLMDQYDRKDVTA